MRFLLNFSTKSAFVVESDKKVSVYIHFFLYFCGEFQTNLSMTPVELKQSALRLLEDNILSFWWNQMRDPNGGFYGRMDGRGQLHPDAERGAVMNARLLWAFSAAYRVLHKPEYLEAADWAKDYIESHFLDHDYGGVYWSVNADGSPLDTKKQTYAIGFMIYGFSEYARATGDEQAKQQAIALYNAIEAHAYDAEHEGYLEAMTREWQPIADMRLSDKDENAAFTMNTHLHVLEPYTNLYRIWPDEHLAKKQRTLIRIFTDRLFNPSTHHVDCFFDNEWHGRRDIASYGHDIEAAWLLNEATKVIQIEAIPQTTLIAQAALEGLQADGSMIHENTDASRQWWVECEAVVGFVDQWSLTGDETWYHRAAHTWKYLTTHLIDRNGGEFFWAILPDGTPDTDNDKAGFWKCPYHNSRMCLELIERL